MTVPFGLRPLRRRNEAGAVVPVIQPSEGQQRDIDLQFVAAKRAGHTAGVAMAENTFRLIQKAREPNENEPWRALDLAALAGKPLPAKEWIVRNWLPANVVSVNYADGGVGKTLLAMQLMVSCATGVPWCGQQVERCKSIGMFSEDDQNEMHLRFDQIGRHFGVSLDQMADAMPLDCVGQDNLLATFDRVGKMELTPRFLRLRELAMDIGAKLICIDTAATVFAGNENDRVQVTKFVGGALTTLARDMRGAVLLNCHPSVAGLQSGSMTSGSTAWSNSARMRWSLSVPKADYDGVTDTTLRVLERRKANGTSIGEQIALRWHAGVLDTLNKPETNGNPFEAANLHMEAERAFLAALAACEAPVSHSKNSSNYGPKLFLKFPQCASFKRGDLERAMNSLMQSGRLTIKAYGRPSNQTTRLVEVAEAELEIAGDGSETVES